MCKHGCSGLDFNNVAHWRACTVTFEESRPGIGTIEPGSRICGANRRYLGFAAGVGDTWSAPVTVSGCPTNYRADGIAVSDGVRERFEEYSVDCLSAAIAVCFCVKAVAFARGRPGGSHSSPVHHYFRGELEICRSYDGTRNLARSEIVTGHIDRCQAS